MKVKVWTVEQSYPCEGSDVVGVFGTEAKADAFVAEQQNGITSANFTNFNVRGWDLELPEEPVTAGDAKERRTTCRNCGAARGAVEGVAVDGPPITVTPNGDTGDSSGHCSVCSEERDEPHTWKECAERSATEVECLIDLLHDPAHARQVLSVAMLPPGETLVTGAEFVEKATAILGDKDPDADLHEQDSESLERGPGGNKRHSVNESSARGSTANADPPSPPAEARESRGAISGHRPSDACGVPMCVDCDPTNVRYGGSYRCGKRPNDASPIAHCRINATCDGEDDSCGCFCASCTPPDRYLRRDTSRSSAAAGDEQREATVGERDHQASSGMPGEPHLTKQESEILTKTEAPRREAYNPSGTTTECHPGLPKDGSGPLPQPAVTESLSGRDLGAPEGEPYERRPSEATATADLNASSWPLHMVIWRLANAVDHLLHDHDCDAHGHEGVLYALQAARAWLKSAGYDLPEERAGTDCHAPNPALDKAVLAPSLVAIIDGWRKRAEDASNRARDGRAHGYGSDYSRQEERVANQWRLAIDEVERVHRTDPKLEALARAVVMEWQRSDLDRALDPAIERMSRHLGAKRPDAPCSAKTPHPVVRKPTKGDACETCGDLPCSHFVTMLEAIESERAWLYNITAASNVAPENRELVDEILVAERKRLEVLQRRVKELEDHRTDHPPCNAAHHIDQSYKLPLIGISGRDGQDGRGRQGRVASTEPNIVVHCTLAKGHQSRHERWEGGVLQTWWNRKASEVWPENAPAPASSGSSPRTVDSDAERRGAEKERNIIAAWLRAPSSERHQHVYDELAESIDRLLHIEHAIAEGLPLPGDEASK